MARLFTAIACTIRPALTVVAAAALALPALTAQARGPERIADVAEQVIDAVVNISTSQAAASSEQRSAPGARPQLPPGSPFEEFFEEFFKNRRGQGESPAPNRPPRLRCPLLPRRALRAGRKISPTSPKR